MRTGLSRRRKIKVCWQWLHAFYFDAGCCGLLSFLRIILEQRLRLVSACFLPSVSRYCGEWANFTKLSPPPILGRFPTFLIIRRIAHNESYPPSESFTFLLVPLGRTVRHKGPFTCDCQTAPQASLLANATDPGACTGNHAMWVDLLID